MKSLFQSRTFWLAMGQATAGVVAVFATAYPGVGGFLIAKSIVDILLRLATTTPIA